jgi:hypothetical protein
MNFTTEQLKQTPVFGIAGNFAEHLTQAGEDADFVNIVTEEPNAPKGIFPIYLPNFDTFLSTFPLSSHVVEADFTDKINLHLEPETCVLFSVVYDASQVVDLKPQAFTAFNDCSIRRPNAKKISEKKNWGKNCTGISANWLGLSSLSEGCELDDYSILSFIKRNGEVIQYGMDSPVVGYQYFHQKLLNWIIKTFNNQQDTGPLEPLNQYINQLGKPAQVIISLGATRYTSFGEKGFLQPNDELGVFVYNKNQSNQQAVTTFFTQHSQQHFDDGCYLYQTVKAK